ncbi:MAG TPA: MAPEG family protein [Hyphomonadaceae bacterium]|nr:MAPEG family protein [Hyphomonadaceae bacterium]
MDGLNMLTPVLALIVWTFVMWFWMYATRIPAMLGMKVTPAQMQSKDSLKMLPARVNWVADNYNHLHEQPTVFYALCIYSHLVGVHDDINAWLAWAYVAIRIVHSLVQAIINFVPMRFYIFTAATLVLMVIAGRNVLALFGM